jgi:signal transduction histidine kinase
MRLRILQKGLIVLIVPVILQVGCILQLYSLIQQADAITAREQRISNSIDLFNELVASFGNWIEDIFSVSKRGQTLAPAAYQRQFRDTVAKLVPLLDGDLQQWLIASSKEISEAQESILTTYARSSDKTSVLMRLSMLAQLKPHITLIARQTDEFRTRMLEQRRELDLMRKQEVAKRDQIKVQVMIVVITEIALTVLLVGLFLGNISSRLAVLMNNSKKLPAHVPLTETVAGGDELADLDKVLHQASQELRTAAEYRASLMQMVAHDLRTPLGSAALALDGIAGPADLPSGDRIAQAQAIKGMLGQLTRFVEDLLTIDKLEAGKLELQEEAIDLSTVIKSVCATLQPLANKKKITLSVESGSIVLAADPDRLAQVLANLIGNAMKFSPENGTVLIKASEADGMARVDVCDQGPGINQETKAKLFQKFFQESGKASSTGFGLGLAICKLIVDAHGGTIGADSPRGGGSIFWFTLPLIE